VFEDEVGLAEAGLRAHVAAGVVGNLHRYRTALQDIGVGDQLAGQRIAVVAKILSRGEKQRLGRRRARRPGRGAGRRRVAGGRRGGWGNRRRRRRLGGRLKGRRRLGGRSWLGRWPRLLRAACGKQQSDQEKQ